MNDLARQATRHWTLALPTVSAFVASLVRDIPTRDDILQETAMAIIDSYDRYDAGKPFLPWAIAIARNQVRLYTRKMARSHLVFDSESIEILAQSFSGEAKVANKKLDHLAECLESLDAEARNLCRLRYEKDLKPAAIGEQIGLSPNGVSKALQRIRDRLRDCIDGKWLAAEGHS